MQLAPTVAELVDAGSWVALDIRADRSRLLFSAPIAVVVGALEPDVPGTAGQTCLGWSTTSATAGLLVGFPLQGGTSWFGPSITTCEIPTSLYCFEP